jgi:hypothetical protein
MNMYNLQRYDNNADCMTRCIGFPVALRVRNLGGWNHNPGRIKGYRIFDARCGETTDINPFIRPMEANWNAAKTVRLCREACFEKCEAMWLENQDSWEWTNVLQHFYESSDGRKADPLQLGEGMFSWGVKWPCRECPQPIDQDKKKCDPLDKNTANDPECQYCAAETDGCPEGQYKDTSMGKEDGVCVSECPLKPCPDGYWRDTNGKCELYCSFIDKTIQCLDGWSACGNGVPKCFPDSAPASDRATRCAPFTDADGVPLSCEATSDAPTMRPTQKEKPTPTERPTELYTAEPTRSPNFGTIAPTSKPGPGDATWEPTQAPNTGTHAPTSLPGEATWEPTQAPNVGTRTPTVAPPPPMASRWSLSSGVQFQCVPETCMDWSCLWWCRCYDCNEEYGPECQDDSDPCDCDDFADTLYDGITYGTLRDSPFMKPTFSGADAKRRQREADAARTD